MITFSFYADKETKAVAEMLGAYIAVSSQANDLIREILGKKLCDSTGTIKIDLATPLDYLKHGSGGDFLWARKTFGSFRLDKRNIVLIVDPYNKKSSDSAYRIFRTLIHELVHYRQNADGLLQLGANSAVWQNEPFPESIPYFERPWEKEAYEKEKLVDRLTDIPNWSYPKAGKIKKILYPFMIGYHTLIHIFPL